MPQPDASLAPRPPHPDWRATEPWIELGHRALLWLIGGLIGFALIFTISGAVVATGTVTVEGSTKTVQHLDGGIVARILVRNGEAVGEGQVLVTLDATAVRAEVAVNTARLAELLIQVARLEAERDRQSELTVPPQLAGLVRDEAVARAIANQRALLDARRIARTGERELLTQRIGQMHNELDSLRSQASARAKEVEINAREVANLQPLFERGLVSQSRMSPLQRETVRLEGEVGRLRAEMAKSAITIAEAELRLAQSEKDFLQSVADEIRKAQASIGELREARKALRGRLERTEVKAPRYGRVHALAIHTEGGVIAPGATLMQIVPDDTPLIVEAQLSPSDVDKVRAGLPASVRFSAFNARSTPRLDGTVSTISAAQNVDPQGRAYFTAEIELPATEIARLGKQHTLVPGMPAEVFIETSSRTILSYFVKPLTDAVSRTFRED